MSTNVRAVVRLNGSIKRHYVLPLVLTIVLVILFVMEMFSGYSEWGAAEAVRSQADLAGATNSGGLFQVAVLAIAGLMAIRAARRTNNSSSRSGWALVAGGAVILAVESVIGQPLNVRGAYLIAFALAVPAFLFLNAEVRGDRAGRHLIWFTMLLVLSNGITEFIKRSIVSNPGNYVYNPQAGVYDFSGQAWDRLWLISNVQELTEVAAVICLIAIIGIATDRRNAETPLMPLPLESTDRIR